jgi:hypothetical protein
MDHKNVPKHYETDQRRDLLDSQIGNPEIAMKAHFAQQFGHVAIRHANKEISEDDLSRFRELYIDKLSKHSLVEDRAALSRDFDKWVDAMLPAALADIYDAKIEQASDDLPEFVSPERMSEMSVRSEDELLRINQELTERLNQVTQENSLFMNQLGGMSKELRKQNALREEIQNKYDNLVLATSIDQSDNLYSHSSTAL